MATPSAAAAAEHVTDPTTERIDPRRVPKVDERLDWIPLAEIHESPHNPRKHFDPAALEQLMDSLLQSGQLEPVLVRPRLQGGYELAAGHRRFRAATLACKQHAEGAAYRGLEKLRAIVREMDDRTFIETLNVDNLQRDDLHPLEEAQGFQDLMTSCGYDVKKIAARIGKSERYVYDSLTLLKLTADAKKLFLEDAFERGHAVELARLTPEWQKKALGRVFNRYDDGRGGLWQAESFDADPTLPAQQRLKLEDRVKPVSVREFRTWINDHVRATPETVDPFLFPDTAQLLAEAQEKKGRSGKIVHITYDYRVPDPARDPKVRTYGSEAWFRADGQFKSKRCEHAVVGLVVAGPGRGQAFLVCVAKEKCAVHWSAWQKERARRRKERAKQTRDGDSKEAYAKSEAARQRREAEDQAERERWEKAESALFKALAAAIKKAPLSGKHGLGELVLEAFKEQLWVNKDDLLPRGRTAEDLVRHLAALELTSQIEGSYRASAGEWGDVFETVGLSEKDARAIVDQVAPKPKAGKKTKATKTAGRRKKR